MREGRIVGGRESWERGVRGVTLTCDKSGLEPVPEEKQPAVGGMRLTKRSRNLVTWAGRWLMPSTMASPPTGGYGGSKEGVAGYAVEGGITEGGNGEVYRKTNDASEAWTSSPPGAACRKIRPMGRWPRNEN